jgi:Arc/MetJ-type ribon-helix-helix transcriptional regulator
MKRTTVMLPAELHEKAAKYAARRRVSMGSVIRKALREALEKPSEESSRDSLWADKEVFRGSTPRDLARRHDHYLEAE